MSCFVRGYSSWGSSITFIFDSDNFHKTDDSAHYSAAHTAYYAAAYDHSANHSIIAEVMRLKKADQTSEEGIATAVLEKIIMKIRESASKALLDGHDTTERARLEVVNHLCDMIIVTIANKREAISARLEREKRSDLQTN